MVAYSRSPRTVIIMGANFTGYEIYLNYKKVLDTLENKDLRTDQIVSLTDISKSTLNHILVDLLKNNIIKIAKYDMNFGKSRVFAKVKPNYGL